MQTSFEGSVFLPTCLHSFLPIFTPSLKFRSLSQKLVNVSAPALPKIIGASFDAPSYRKEIWKGEKMEGEATAKPNELREG